MQAQRAATALLALAALAGCGDPAADPNAQGSTTPPYVRAESEASLLNEAVTPVRVGELGPGFAACNARGAARERGGGGEVAVRSAPFEQAAQIDRLAAGAEFFICSRTHDQRWFGIVYDEGGQASERCGVSSPAPERRPYQGPCAAGWVPSLRVRLVSGVPHQLPPQGETNVSAPPTE
jgi:hypothetical protein